MGIDIFELSLIDEYILDQTKSGFEDLFQLEDLETYYNNLLDLDDLCQNFQKNMKLEFDDGREYTNEDEGHWYPDDRTMLGFPEDRQSRCPDEFMSSHFNEEKEYSDTDDSLPITSMSQLTINEADESDVSEIFEIWHRIDWG